MSIINKKHLIFLGGEAGVGKSISASELQKSLDNSIVIDKDETTSILVNALLESYNQPSSDRESKIYLSKIKPLEYQQLDEIVWDGITNTSMIVTAPYFDSFINAEWIIKMKALGDFHSAKVSFVFITRCPNKIRTGLVDRNANRDKWKIKHYSEYRANTDKIINSVLRNKQIKHLPFGEKIDIKQLIKYIKV